MEVYRISQDIFADDLNGTGAKLYGGRWNSAGLSALYAASTRSLALLETLAHTPAKMLQLKTYILTVIYIPDNAAQQVISLSELTAGWDAMDIHDQTTTKGDRFLRTNQKLVLSVPSVLMPEENIFVINPRHDDMEKVKIIHKRRVYFDRRIV